MEQPFIQYYPYRAKAEGVGASVSNGRHQADRRVTVAGAIRFFSITAICGIATGIQNIHCSARRYPVGHLPEVSGTYRRKDQESQQPENKQGPTRTKAYY